MELLSKINRVDFESVFKKLGYAYFDKGRYNLNIIGIRSNNNKSNTFNDAIVVEYIGTDFLKKREVFSATTDPGLYYRQHPTCVKGTAILVPGQYRGVYEIGLHKGQYEALVQRKPVKVYRDNNKDEILDFDSNKTEIGVFGINIHKAGKASYLVDKWSAGCQVLRLSRDLDRLLALCYKQINNGHGSTFSYTLIDEKDLF